MTLVKSKARVRDFGEVFTPEWLVQDMLNLVPRELERIDSRFLETACGSGNFLVAVLLQKLQVVDTRYGTNEFERRQHGLLALMSLYGIEIQSDNVNECRLSLATSFAKHFKIESSDNLYLAAVSVLSNNIVLGDAIELTNSHGKPLMFAEWAYLGKGKFQRRDFIFSELVQMSSFGEGTLFSNMEPDEIFKPMFTHPQVNIEILPSLPLINSN
jgi:hypothetical protein